MTMPTQSPLKLLEIHIISANDLPPVSKMLRTFAVAYVDPDNKQTTQIDHQGHTKPKWNHKAAFHVDDDFLKNDSSAVTFEIYNLAWLRDLPIGTAQLSISKLSPPLAKNPGFRRVSVRIRQPSGHLKGTLNLGVQLVDNVAPGHGMGSPSSFEKIEELYEEEDPKIYVKEQEFNFQEQEIIINPTGPERAESGCVRSPVSSRVTFRLEPEAETRTAGGSLYSAVRPLPSEVASSLKKGVYSDESNDFGSWIFDNWTEVGDRSYVDMKAETELGSNDRVPMITDNELLMGRVHREKEKKGLFSCFWKVSGMRFGFVCGSEGLEKKRKKGRNVDHRDMHLMSLPAQGEYDYARRHKY